MRAFIFDKYGYYPPNEDSERFEMEGWVFHLASLKEQTEEEMERLSLFIDQLARQFHRGARIIKNRDGFYISNAEFGKVILVATTKGAFALPELMQLHHHYKGTPHDEPYTISYLMTLWESKVDLIEEKALTSIKVDDYAYQKMMVSAIHAIGLAENAIQYLAEMKIDFGDQLGPLTLSHRRLDSLDNEMVLDPLNLILDVPSRDLAELFKAGVLDTNSLLNLLPAYHFSVVEASLLLARLLFPTRIFDLLEDHYGWRVDVRSRILAYYQAIPSSMKNLAMIERYLVAQYGIRPISWIHQ